jgi:hypothetical protein
MRIPIEEQERLRPQEFDDIRKLRKRPWGGALKASRCFCCGSILRLANHHIEPRSEGGSDDRRNKVTLCSICHDAVEGKPWSAILARRDSIREERYAQRYPGRPISEADDWLGRSPREKIASIRRYCLTRGVLHNSEGATEDFRQAFRTLNRIYCELNPRSGISATCQNNAAGTLSGPPLLEHILAVQSGGLRSKIDRLLWDGTQEEWVGAILELAYS